MNDFYSMEKANMNMKRNMLLFCLTLLVGLSACGQQELEKLSAENQVLKTKVLDLEQENIEIGMLRARIQDLEQENAKLKETDQIYFSRALDTFNNATSKASLQSALDMFIELTEKFPRSTYLPKVKQHIAEIQKKISDIERMETIRSAFNNAMASRQFATASAELEKLKLFIPINEHKALSAKLSEEQNKPTETTINRLVSDFGSLMSKFDVKGMLAMDGQRVRVEATFTSIDRGRKELRADSDGWGKGSTLSVFYKGTSMEDHFTDNDPKCCNNRYIVTGVTKIYSNADQLYIKADKIEIVRP